MNPDELAALKAYLAKPDNVSFTWNDQTLTLAEWIAVRDDAAVAACLSDPAIGESLGKTLERSSVSADEVKTALATSADFGSVPEQVMAKLRWIVDTNPVNLGNAELVAAVNSMIDAFPDTKSRFNALRVRSASIAESLIGRPIGTNEVSEVLNGQ